MRIGTVRDLRNHYTSLLSWINAGERPRPTSRGSKQRLPSDDSCTAIPTLLTF